MYTLLLLFVIIDCSLETDRYSASSAWINKVNSLEKMELAYSDLYTTKEMIHVVNDFVIYSSREVSYEDSSIIFTTFGSPVYKIFAEYDPMTIRQITPDIWHIFYYINFTKRYVCLTKNHIVYQSIFRSSDFIVFYPNSSKIKIVYTDFGSDYLISAKESERTIKNSIVCSRIFDDNKGSPYLEDSIFYLGINNYSLVDRCTTYLDNLHSTKCPHSIQNNAFFCKLIHATNFILASDCYFPQKKSLCINKYLDQCDIECSDCHEFADCKTFTPELPTNFDTHYGCKCKNGYVGNGTYCEPLYCDSENVCPANAGSYNCSSGLCMCKETYETNPVHFDENSLCTCSPPSQIFWINNSAICVKEGRCLGPDINSRHMCTAQKFEQVKCSLLPNNRWTEFGVCKCNYGFYGGVEFSCVCPSDRRVMWSATIEGETCLAIHECTESWHCAYPEICQKQESNIIGLCSNPLTFNQKTYRLIEEISYQMSTFVGTLSSKIFSPSTIKSFGKRVL